MEFEKKSEVLPFNKYGIASLKEFKGIEKQIKDLEHLKRAGLSDEEIKLYLENETGFVNRFNKVESTVLQEKLKEICIKISNIEKSEKLKPVEDLEPSTSASTADKLIETLQKRPMKLYPDGHPMNSIKHLEEKLFGHLKDDSILPITKRRKLLRRLERKKEKIMSQSVTNPLTGTKIYCTKRTNSLWDVREAPLAIPSYIADEPIKKRKLIGPQRKTIYTIKNNKILRLEPVQSDHSDEMEHRAVEIVLPINKAEERLLEGTKLTIEEIKKIERFKDYEPGIPSKVLYLKNISPSATKDHISLLFNQFVHENRRPIDVRLLSGRMRGQAFVAFQEEDLAIRALEDINGTIVEGKPIIVQFGKNSNRIQNDDER